MCRQLIIVVLALLVAGTWPTQAQDRPLGPKRAPKVMLVNMFTPEAEIWQKRLPESGLGDLRDVRIHVPGLSMLFPHVLCVADGSICQATIGEGEINGAATMMALALSDAFNLTRTYFLVSGIAGVNPKYGTLGSVAIVKYAVQVALQYEVDARSMPHNWETGYLAYGTSRPFQYPSILYGSEVFELNENLRDWAFNLARHAILSDSGETIDYRRKYQNATGVNATNTTAGPAAAQPPTVLRCDSVTSDVYFSGDLLGSAFEKTATVWTNGSAQYCMTAQEDNAALEVLVRAAIEGRVDYSRAIIMRAGSNFDRPPQGVTPYHHLVVLEQNGFAVAVENLFNAGIPVVKGIIDLWDCQLKAGIKPSNYIGDVFGSLGGHPDFGPGSLTNGATVEPGGRTAGLRRRAMGART